ncbi:hypothetical protein [Burkholderia savannae]|uniref:hypothetical protein n=1 Tax=Burkholderia savannae TaxID=1637837 RepID=UPI0012F50547|nr:hypothetical protein [Burkholderia savannae]
MRNRDERLATIAVVHAVFSDSARVIHACRSACAISPSAYRTMAKLSVRPRWAALGRVGPRASFDGRENRIAAAFHPFRGHFATICRQFPAHFSMIAPTTASHRPPHALSTKPGALRAR